MTTMIHIRGLLFVTGVTGCCCTWCGDGCVDKSLRSCTAVVVAMTSRTGAVVDTVNLGPVCKGGAVTLNTAAFRCPRGIVVGGGSRIGVKTVYQVTHRMVAGRAVRMAIEVAGGMTLGTIACCY